MHDAEQGKRSVSLIRGAKHAYDLGASMQQIINLVDDVADYWSEAPQQKHIDNIHRQIMRWKY